MTIQCMARPPKPPEKKRKATVKCHVTEADKIRFEELAFENGLTISDLIKLKVLGTEPKRRKATPERAILIRHLANLGRIGSNINQIARALNSGRNAFDMPPNIISEALTELNKLSNRIFDNLDTHGH